MHTRARKEVAISGTVAFSMIGICFSLEKTRQKLVKLGAPASTLHLGKVQMLCVLPWRLLVQARMQHLKELRAAELP
ncbi:MAG TPA: hypothetical protein V6D03_12165 [Candidatus Caenarcaniphilales bacterium]